MCLQRLAQKKFPYLHKIAGLMDFTTGILKKREYEMLKVLHFVLSGGISSFLFRTQLCSRNKYSTVPERIKA